ncbi:MAG TPA: methyltransferase domain-containing protein [Opitutaceae bacterium]|jgi:tRNA (guanine-N7-)-methyltransferase
MSKQLGSAVAGGRSQGGARGPHALFGIESGTAGVNAPGYSPTPSKTPRALERQEALRALVSDLGTDLILEIGCGHGHFLAAYGAAHPERRCVGVDMSLDRVVRAERKRRRGKLDNVRFVRADIENFLAVIPAPTRFTTIFLLFPDPWPKRRHYKHRLMQADFLQRLAPWCRPEARLHFRTDHPGYFSDGKKAVAAAPAWEIADGPWPFEFETIFQARAPHHQSLIARRR